MNNYYTNPYMYPQSPQMPVPQSNRQSGLIWVNGEEGARSYVIAPNSNVMLLDAENEGRFYIKTADNIGMTTLRIFEYKEILDATPVSAQNHGMQPNVDPQTEYATKQDLQELKDLINSLSFQNRGGGRNEQSIQSAQFRAKNVPNANSSRE